MSYKCMYINNIKAFHSILLKVDPLYNYEFTRIGIQCTHFLFLLTSNKYCTCTSQDVGCDYRWSHVHVHCICTYILHCTCTHTCIVTIILYMNNLYMYMPTLYIMAISCLIQIRTSGLDMKTIALSVYVYKSWVTFISSFSVEMMLRHL